MTRLRRNGLKLIPELGRSSITSVISFARRAIINLAQGASKKQYTVSTSILIIS